jgi:hypothetical protein
VAGTGVSAGERQRADGTRVSALRFASLHPLSLIEEGSGYWRYVPTDDGVRFVTGYDYRARPGRFGTVADRFVFRPLTPEQVELAFDYLLAVDALSPAGAETAVGRCVDLTATVLGDLLPVLDHPRDHPELPAMGVAKTASELVITLTGS